MTALGVIHLPSKFFPGKQVKDAMGRERTGWFVVENGQLGYPFETQEQAVKQASGINSIRCARIASIRVIDAKGQISEVTL